MTAGPEPLGDATCRALAVDLHAAHRARARFAPVTAAGLALALDDAYRVQDRFVHLLREEHATPVAGWKIGLTSATMQQMCGIDHPVHGRVLATRVQPTPATTALSRHVHLGIEFEVAARLGRDFALDGAVEPAAEAARDAVDAVAAALELVDDRHADYARLDAASLVADNAWNAGVVLGPWQPVPPDLVGRRGTLRIDDEVVEEGRVGVAAEHPLAAVAWLARELHRRGSGLRRGDVVMTGSILRTRFPATPGRWIYDVEGLGSVALTVEA
jgi:2-keto-4-pentenoate hydratase